MQVLLPADVRGELERSGRALNSVLSLDVEGALYDLVDIHLVHVHRYFPHSRNFHVLLRHRSDSFPISQPLSVVGSIMNKIIWRYNPQLDSERLHSRADVPAVALQVNTSRVDVNLLEAVVQVDWLAVDLASVGFGDNSNFTR